MKRCVRTLAYVTVAAVAAACSASSGSTSSGPLTEESASISGICVSPVVDRTSVAAGDNEIVTVVSEPGRPMITMEIDHQVVDLFDDGTSGDAVAGDGVFTRTVHAPEAPSTRVCEGVAPPQAAPSSASNAPGQSTEGVEFECHTVPCKPDCKSVIFGTTCYVCVECGLKVKIES